MTVALCKFWQLRSKWVFVAIFAHLEVTGYWIPLSFVLDFFDPSNCFDNCTLIIVWNTQHTIDVKHALQRMHQYKTVAQILFILSIFNLVLAAPVVRDTYDARDDVAAPTAVGNVAVMSKERHQSRSDVATSSPSSLPLPEGSTTSHSSPLLPPFLYASSSSDREGSLHELPTRPLADEPTSSAVLSPPGEIVPASSSSSDGEGPFELPTHPDEPTSLAVSPPSGVIVPAVRRPVPSFWQGDAASMARLHGIAERHQLMRQGVIDALKKSAFGLAVVGVAGGAVAFYRKLNHHHRAIDPDCSTFKGSRHPCDDY